MLNRKVYLIALPALAMSASAAAMADTVTRYETSVSKNVTTDSARRDLGAGVIEYKSVTSPAPYVVESKTTTVTRGPSRTLVLPTASSLSVASSPLVVEKRVIVEKPVFVEKPVVIEKQVFVEKPVFVERVITPQPVIFYPGN